LKPTKPIMDKWSAVPADRRDHPARTNVKVLIKKCRAAQASQSVHAPGAAFRGHTAHRRNSQTATGYERRTRRHLHRTLQLFSANWRTERRHRSQLRALALRSQTPAPAGTEPAR